MMSTAEVHPKGAIPPTPSKISQAWEVTLGYCFKAVAWSSPKTLIGSIAAFDTISFTPVKSKSTKAQML